MGKKTLVTRAENFSEWYNAVVDGAGLAEHSPVRGCMIIKPYGFAMRENMKNILDAMFKKTGHVNAYFPLLIPKSFFTKEAKHVEGFATEAAIVTHYRLKRDEKTHEMIVDPEAKLEEELIIRPTSETIIRNTYRNWINSYRDLPILINQRANVMRREMRTRLFLRTSEFLWQEGHTAHANAEEASKEALKMHQIYNDFLMNIMCISGVLGEKSESERFAGAEHTYTIEPMMQDGKALQSCTSHDLGQNFGKAFDVTFTSKENKLETAYATSWGMSTRALGGMIMSHSDDSGLVVPPALAPLHVVVVPFFRSEEDLQEMRTYTESFLHEFSQTELSFKTDTLGDRKTPLSYKFDDDDAKSPGWKFNEYELQGVPVRVTVGKKEAENGQVEVYRRDTGEKKMVAVEDVTVTVRETLMDIQSQLLKKNIAFREQNTVIADTREEFKASLDDGKFVFAHRDGTSETEKKIQDEYQVVTRCIPFDMSKENGKCIYSGNPSEQRVLFAKAY